MVQIGRRLFDERRHRPLLAELLADKQARVQLGRALKDNGDLPTARDELYSLVLDDEASRACRNRSTAC